jgi:hypothetical protein
LSRRAGHRESVLRQYHQDVKRQLGKRYRLDPSLPDADYVAALAGYQPGLDAPALVELLRQLAVERPAEEHMIRWAAKAAERIREAG